MSVKGWQRKQAERVIRHAYGMLDRDRWRLLLSIQRAIRSAYRRGARRPV